MRVGNYGNKCCPSDLCALQQPPFVWPSRKKERRKHCVDFLLARTGLTVAMMDRGHPRLLLLTAGVLEQAVCTEFLQEAQKRRESSS